MGERQELKQSKLERTLNDFPTLKKQTSMSTLIVWNISKALKSNPSIDLRSAMRVVQERLEHDSYDLDVMISQYPEERHLICAILAWQQLGHHDTDSLYQFIERKNEKVDNLSKENSPNVIHYRDTNSSMASDSGSINMCTMGPVVKLPIQTNIVMRMENVPNTRPKKPKEQEKDIMDKIDAACCLESGCLERLSALDKTTNELRSRAAKLAKRESERVELLERAEAAWKDLELGYQRRLGLAEEKEEDLAKQIQRLIDERKGNKNACMALAKQLKERGDAAEKERARLTKIEKDVYDRACIRLRLSEEAARCDATLAEQQCKAAQLDRDLQFKEEQTRRKIISMESEVESARTLTHEAERAMRAELGALREQISEVSKQLLDEDKDNSLIKEALEQLRAEKMELIEDLEGCKVMCENRMQGRVDELKNRREQLNALKEKVLECRCKLPVDESVEVKRTPSLAALCRCTPENYIEESCSCTSLRSRLLSNLLSDLFGGLRAELGETGTQMPCQLLKCLEDKHNWDRSSNVKTNLRNYFSKLLLGELDIAIASSIENYHAKWVGSSCADQGGVTPDAGEADNEPCQERALELKVQKLATEIVEQALKERAKELEKRLKNIVACDPPLCDCSQKTAAFTCMVKQNMRVNETKIAAPANWHHTVQDVTQLRLQIEALKKESIKKDDLKKMEDNITKMVQQASGLQNLNANNDKNIKANRLNDQSKNIHKSLRTNLISPEKPTAQKKQSTMTPFKRENTKTQLDNKSLKSNKRFRQDYAVNMCLCNNSKSQKQSKELQNVTIVNALNKDSRQEKPSKDIMPQISSIRQTKPINNFLTSPELDSFGKDKVSTQFSCLSNCVCFQKMPSNTSIDRLLESLTRWKCDLKNSESKIKDIKEIGLKITDINNDLVTNCSSILKNSPKSNKEFPNNSKTLLTDIDTSEDINVKNILPRTIESEYMGAINLDKSNENFCKCVKDIKSSALNIISSKKNEDIPIKFISSVECNCVQSQTLNLDNTGINKNSLEQTQDSKENKLVGLQKTSKKELLNDMKLYENSTVLENILKINDKEQKGLISWDYDYHVNFLGVTLASALACPIKHGIKASKELQNFKKEEEKIFNDNVTKTCILPSSAHRTSENWFKEKSNTKNYPLQQSSSNNKNISDCNCKGKFKELKDSIREKLDMKREKSTFIQNELMDTDGTHLSPSTNEPCICCNIQSLEESKNLEENTFRLIEVHLKEKLDEFKISFCKSSCIPPHEEDQFFSAMLHRVKEVISNSTKEMACKCSDDDKIKGSWIRAYGLLEEYLKMKLKRVQCFCGSTSINNDMTITLNNVLEKVCQLIEKDFERLKNICNCKNVNEKNPSKINSICTNIFPNDLPEKDIHNTFNIVSAPINTTKTDFDLESKQNSNKSIILTQNTSSQVPQNLGMENKSCIAINKSSKNIQTQESKYNFFNKSCKISLCSCSKKQNEEPFLELLGRNDLCVRHCTDIKTNKLKNDVIVSQLMKKNSIVCILDKPSVKNIDGMNHADVEKCVKEGTHCIQQDTLPYVGKTVDCSCEGKISSCVCMKSIIETDNDKIISIWNKLTQNIKCQPKVSYIMNSVINRAQKQKPDTINLATDIDAGNLPNVYSIQNSIRTCDISISPLQTNEDIVLKTSNGVSDQRERMTNTYNENFDIDYSNIDVEADLHAYKHLDKCQINFRKELNYSKVFANRNSIQYNQRDVLNNGESKNVNNDIKMCDCNTVPVCHVQMLVQSIEKKLINEQCICDSLSAKVCPVHAPNSYS